MGVGAWVLVVCVLVGEVGQEACVANPSPRPAMHSWMGSLWEQGMVDSDAGLGWVIVRRGGESGVEGLGVYARGVERTVVVGGGVWRWWEALFEVQLAKGWSEG